MTQRDIQGDRWKPDAIALGSHYLDSHHVQRVAISPTHFRNEGRIWVKVARPYAIRYRSVTPREEDCTNLLVPVCLSASHVAFCSLRLESTWMGLGHAVGSAAAMAGELDVPVQRVDVTGLQAWLRQDGVGLGL
jgi:hypothetical protein